MRMDEKSEMHIKENEICKFKKFCVIKKRLFGDLLYHKSDTDFFIDERCIVNCLRFLADCFFLRRISI